MLQIYRGLRSVRENSLSYLSTWKIEIATVNIQKIKIWVQWSRLIKLKVRTIPSPILVTWIIQIAADYGTGNMTNLSRKFKLAKRQVMQLKFFLNLNQVIRRLIIYRPIK